MQTRILLIDDEPRWVGFAKDNLAQFEVVVVSDASSAIEQLEARQFDLVIASSRRLDVLEAISERFSDKCIVVATVQESIQEALQAYRLGAKRYFAKSFEREYLLDKVNDIVCAPKSNGTSQEVSE